MALFFLRFKASLLRAYLNGKIYVNIFALFCLIFHFFYKENGANSQASQRKCQFLSKYFLFGLVVKIRLKRRDDDQTVVP